MNSGITSERVFAALKRSICRGAYRPGERLDPALLASELNSSITPVRDALHLLCGEALITTRTGDGFHLPSLDAPALQDRYDWNAEVLALALKASPPPPYPVLEVTGTGPVETVTAIFGRIADRSRNAEHRRALHALNDRLMAVREIEPHVLDAIPAEVDHLLVTFNASDDRALRAAIVRYHQRRRRRVAELVRALYRDSA